MSHKHHVNAIWDEDQINTATSAKPSFKTTDRVSFNSFGSELMHVLMPNQLASS